ncbi:MAG: response regulator [Gammaproteobacteria bacterium]|jgi:two-component system invasion response regulator UvrY|nr:response regulator [Gammaproteobacteria bacterium]
MIKVMIVDDHELIRSGVAALLSDLPNIEVIATVGSGEEAILLAKQQKPNVILMDVRMPGIGGIAATQKIAATHPDIKIIALTSCTEEPFPTNLLKAGAHGYLTKGASVEKMAQAIQSVASGKKFLDPEIAHKLALKNTSNALPSPFEQLSIREFNIVLMLNNGLSHKAIAEKLFISTKTLNSYRYNIYEKLNVKTDVELILLANQTGLIEP